MRVYEEFIDKMRIRLFIVSAMMMPVVFLFGLESYLERYDVHTKYLSQLKDTLLKNGGESSRNPTVLANVIANIDEGEFSNAAACLWVSQKDNKCSGEEFNKTNNSINVISSIDALKGGYKDRGEKSIEVFLEKIDLKRVSPERKLSFDFNYDFISDNDIESWNNFNHVVTGRRFSYYTSSTTTLPSFGPVINYSNVPPVIGGRVRILAVSDSFGAGDALMSKDDTWARELELQLNLLEDKYEVVVLAQGGAGYNDFLNWVEDGYIEAIDPDLVLFSYFKNDFNLVRDFASQISEIKLSGLDKEMVFYLRCFEEDDNLVGRILKKINKFFPSLYRFYKFSRCSEELSSLDSTQLIDKVGVIDSYKRIDTLINVPTFLYRIESPGDWERLDVRGEVLEVLRKNGLDTINDFFDGVLENDGKCNNMASIGYQSCEEFTANKFDPHFNRYYNKMHILSQIDKIKSSIDTAILNSEDRRELVSKVNKSEDIISDYLPNTLFVSNSREGSRVALFRDKLKPPITENFCVPFDRKGVVINFNRYLTEGREIRVSSKFQRDGLALVSRGYDSEGREIYGEAIELRAGSSVSFSGGESVRGLIVLGNNKDCSSKEIDSSEEFLLEVEVL